MEISILILMGGQHNQDVNHKKKECKFTTLFQNTSIYSIQALKSSYNVRNNPTKWEGKFNTKVLEKTKKTAETY